MKNNPKKKAKRNYERTAIFLTLIGIAIIVGYIALLYNQDKIAIELGVNMASVGAFGDFIGGVVGSLWALAGIFLFIQALNEQREDIETNVEMLKLQIETMEENQKMHEQQVETMELQQFENTFFSLMEMFYSLNDKMILPVTKKKKILGKEIFEHCREQIYTAVNSKMKNTSFKEIQTVLKPLSFLEFNKLFSKYEYVLGVYFKLLKRILEFIDNSDFERSKKMVYTKILRSQLTESEIFLLYYYT